MIENMNTERDGLRYPSIDELTNKASSKYKLVIAASKRAKEIDATQKSYLEETKNTNRDVYEYLLPYSKGARCTFPGFKCTAPCVFGGKKALERNI